MTGGAAVAQRWGVNTLVGVALAAIFVPLVLTLYLSVFDETLILFPPKGYTLRWYARILPEFGKPLRVSGITAVVATCLSLLIGVPAGIGLSRHRFGGREAVMALLLAPLTIPGVAIGLGIFVLSVLIEERTGWPISSSIPVMIARDVSLEIAGGELVGLLGPSGCGKTTTWRVVAGFVDGTSGDVLLDGQSIRELPPYRREMGLVFQSYALFPHLSVFRNIAFGLE